MVTRNLIQEEEIRFKKGLFYPRTYGTTRGVLNNLVATVHDKDQKWKYYTIYHI